MSPEDGDGNGDGDGRTAAVRRMGRRDLSEYPSRWPVSGWARLGIIAFILALFVLPAVMTYTHLFGREVSVRIDRCDLPSRTGDGCRGSWTDSHGERNTTTLWHVGEEDQGRTVKARLGPMGAHTGSLSEDWPVFLMLLPLLGIPWYLLALRSLDRSAAEGLLIGSESFLTMIVDHERARRRDRKEYLRVRFDDPDVRLPEGPEPGCLASVRRPDGDIAFLIERRADQILVLGVNGETEAVISRPERRSGRPRIELPDGTLLAEVTGTGGRYGKGVRAIVVPDGTEVGLFGRLRSRRWALRLFLDHSPALTNAVIAYLFTAGRA